MNFNTLHSGASILEAAQLMETSNLAEVLIADGGNTVGTLTDREIVIRVIAKGLDPMQVRVSDVMSPLTTSILAEEWNESPGLEPQEFA